MGYQKPNRGQSLSGTVDSAVLWRDVVRLVNSKLSNETPKVNNAGFGIIVRFINEDGDVDAGKLVQFDGNLYTPGAGDSDAAFDMARMPLLKAITPVWHTDIDRLAIIPDGLEQNYSESLTLSRTFTTQAFTLVKDDDRYAMIDPQNPDQILSSDVGPFRLMAYDQNHNWATLSLDEGTFLWRYRATGGQLNQEFSAVLVRLDGDDHANGNAAITVSDPLDYQSSVSVGDTGYVIHHGNKFYALPGTGSVALAAFQLDTRINPGTGIGAATVTQPYNGAPAIGQSLQLVDATRLWVDLEVGCLGLAIDVGNDQWEILHAQRPAKQIRVKLTATLNSDDPEAGVDWTDKQLRDALPHIDDTAAPDQNNVANPFGFDAIYETGSGSSDSYIWIERYQVSANPYTNQWVVVGVERKAARFVIARVTNANIVGFPGPYDFDPEYGWDGEVPDDNFSVTLPTARYSTHHALRQNEKCLFSWNPEDGEYEYVTTVKQYADWVIGQVNVPAGYIGGTRLNGALIHGFWWEGDNPPGPHDVIIPCWPLQACGTPYPNLDVVCVWSPEDQCYYAVATCSAFLGAPVEKQTATIDPMTRGPSSGQGQYCLEQVNQSFLAFDCSAGQGGGQGPSGQPSPTESCIDSKQFFDDMELCEYICLYCTDIIFEPGKCEPPCDPECCDCTFDPSDPPTVTMVTGPGNEQTLQLTKVAGECAWEGLWNDGTSTVRVSYGCCGDWTVEGIPGDSGVSMTTDPDSPGDCQGGNVKSFDNTHEATVTASGEPCDGGSGQNDCDCCTWECGAEITELSYSQGNLSYDQTGDSRQMGCEFEVPITINCSAGDQNCTILDALASVSLVCKDMDGNILNCNDPGNPEAHWKVSIEDATEDDCCDQLGFNFADHGFLVPCGSDVGELCDGLQEESPGSQNKFRVTRKTPGGGGGAALSTVSRRTSSGLGDYLARKSPELFIKPPGCKSCGSTDARMLLNRYGPHRAPDKLDKVAERIHSSTSRSNIESVASITVSMIEAELRNGIEQYKREHDD